MVRLHTRMPSLRSSPRIRSAPHRRLSLAISLPQGHGLCGDLGCDRHGFGLVFPPELEALAMPARASSLAGRETGFVSRSAPCLPAEPGASGPSWYRQVASPVGAG